jgi:hypothetical protein
MKAQKTNKANNARPVAATRIDPKLMDEIQRWCDRTGITPAVVFRRLIELGWPLFTADPFAEKKTA